MTSPSHPYHASPSPPSKGRKLAIIGMVLNLGVLVGQVGAILFILPAYWEAPLISGSEELADAMSARIQRAMLFFGAFFFVGLVGVILVCISLLKQRFRERWFFVSGVVAASLWCMLVFPIGLVPGILLFVLFLGRRKQFYPSD